METKEEILFKHLNKNFSIKEYEKFVESIMNAMDEYAEQQNDLTIRLFTKPTKELKPLEDLWRLENPSPNGYYICPDTTSFYKWIRIKILGK